MKFILLLFVISSLLLSQDEKIERIYYTICNRAGIEVSKPFDFKPFDTGKCGFNLYVEAGRNWDKFNEIQKLNIKKSLERPQLQVSILSPSKKFRIHFDTTGINEPFLFDQNGNKIQNSWKMYIDSVAKYIDSVYNVEVNLLGFEFDFNDNGAGGGNEYDIYIQDLDDGLYGETVFDPSSPLPRGGAAKRYLSYMRIDNSYHETSYYTRGIDGLKVTLAHEFGHAIQILSYGLWFEDIWFYEMTSTWLEEVVFDEVNDYYVYIPRFFRSTKTPIYLQDGYSLAILGIFLQERFTHSIMVKAWENIRNYASLLSLEFALNFFNSSLRREFVEFSLWNYYTGSRAKTGYYYKEAKNYPEIRFETQPVIITSNEAMIENSTGALSTQYYKFIWRSDTIIAIISNVNLSSAFARFEDEFIFQYHITTGNYEGYTTLGNGLKVKLKVSDFDNWGNLNILNSQVALAKDANVFPNPFYADGIEKILIPVDPVAGEIELKIFTAGLDLVYSAKLKPEFNLGDYFVSWNGRNQQGELVKSGVYIYFVNSGKFEKIGKFVLIRK